MPRTLDRGRSTIYYGFAEQHLYYTRGRNACWSRPNKEPSQARYGPVRRCNILVYRRRESIQTATVNLTSCRPPPRGCRRQGRRLAAATTERRARRRREAGRPRRCAGKAVRAKEDVQEERDSSDVLGENHSASTMTTTSRSLSRDLTQWPATDRVLSTDRTADDHSTFIPSRTAADSLCGPETATVRRRKCEKLDFSSCGEKDLQLDRKRFADRQQFCQHYSTRFFRAACAVDLWSKSGWSPGGHKGGSRRLSQGWRVEKGYPSPPRNGYECSPPNKGYREETIPLPRKINLSLKMTCFDKFWVVYFVRALPDTATDASNLLLGILKHDKVSGDNLH